MGQGDGPGAKTQSQRPSCSTKVNIIKVEVKPRIEAKTRVSNCIETNSKKNTIQQLARLLPWAKVTDLAAGIIAMADHATHCMIEDLRT